MIKFFVFISDSLFINKTLHPLVVSLDSCSPSPCSNDAPCVTDNITVYHSCQCSGPYTG